MMMMDRKFKRLLLTMCAFLCGLCLCRGAFGQELPDGEGKAEYVHNCTACHRTEMVTRVKKTPDEWRKSVDEMASRGTDGTKEDLDKVVIYLDTFYSTDKPAQTPASPPPPPAKQPATSGGSGNRQVAAVAPAPGNHVVRLTTVERRWLTQQNETRLQ